MFNATMIVPVGTFTSDLSARVREAAFQRAQQRVVVISMQSTGRITWKALSDFAESLRTVLTPYPIHLACTLPRVRALLRELGIENGWFINHADAICGIRIFIQSDRQNESFNIPQSRRDFSWDREVADGAMP